MFNFRLPEINSYEEFEKLKPNKDLWESAARKIIDRHGLSNQQLIVFPEGSNIVFGYGSDQIIKIFVPVLKDQYESEKLVLEQVYGKLTVLTPRLQFSGELDGWPYIIMTRIEGRTLEGLWETLPIENKTILIRQLGNLIREMHSISVQGLESIDSHWDTFLENQKLNCLKRHQSLNLPLPLINEIPSYLAASNHLLPKGIKSVLLTGEYTPMNLMVKENNGLFELHGLIDFGDSMLGAPEYDFLGPGAFLVQGNKQLARELLISYGYSTEDLNSNLSRKLTALTLLHKHSNLNVQIRIPNWQEQAKTLQELESLIWGF
jgi:hygromycin-B 7''-O-kinase